MKKEFEADLLSVVLADFDDWQKENDVVVYSVKQTFDIDMPVTMTAWYVEKDDED